MPIKRRDEFLVTKPVVTCYHPGTVFTLAVAIVKVEDRTFIGEGIARRSKLDRPDMTRGDAIAGGRALKALKLKLAKKGIPSHHILMG